jgi:thiol:disulfide interchange protein
MSPLREWPSVVRSDTKTTAGFVVVAVALWLGAQTVTESAILQAAILLGVGVVAPTLLNEWRSPADDE